MRLVVVRVAVGLLVCSASGLAMGQLAPSCPWVAIGTAERLLGGNVILTGHVESPTSGSCRFERQSGDTTSAIEIVVGPVDTNPCPVGSQKLRSLGNEAVQCRRSGVSGHQTDIISGRIRKLYFAVSMTNIPDATRKEPDDPRLADAYAASQIERLAEQVVGNLY